VKVDMMKGMNERVREKGAAGQILKTVASLTLDFFVSPRVPW
jgi:hypothetical protein